MSNTKGISFVVLSMAAFTFEDMFLKLLLVHLPVGQLLCMFGLGTASIFTVIMWIRGIRFDESGAWGKLPFLRIFCEAGAALTFYLALSTVELTLVAAVYQAVPLVIMIGAALVLREQVGWRRWIAVLIALLGVVLILRPGSLDFDPNSFWAVLSVLFVAGRDLATRRIREALSSTLISFQGFAVLIPAGLLWHFAAREVMVPISFTNFALTLGGVLFGAIGYYCIVRGMRLGEVSIVAPFRYSRILFATMIGAIVFGERVDMLALVGIVLIVAAGLYSFRRETRESAGGKV